MDESWLPFLPAGIVVKSAGDKGRGLFTSEKKTFKAGEIVLSASPLFYVVNSDEKKLFCHHCLTRLAVGGLQRCGKCQFTHYCSRQCQKQDWSFHKKECSRLQFLSSAPGLLVDEIRLVARCLVYLTITKSLPDMPGDATNKMDLLCPCDKVYQEYLHMNTVNAVLKLIGMESSIDSQFAVEMLLKVTKNVIGITNYHVQQKPVGSAIYFIPSLLNHSCQPNCIYTNDGSTALQCRAIEDIAVDKELVIGYVGILDTRITRQENLKKNYGFVCCCARCSTDIQGSIDELMESYRCPNCTHPVYPSHPMGSSYKDCSHHEAVDKTLADKVVDEITTTLTKLDNQCEMSNNWNLMREVAKEYLSKQNSLLYKLHISKLKTLQELIYASGVTENWKDAVKYTEMLMEYYNIYLPKYHFVRGFRLKTLGGLYLNLPHRRKLALSTLLQAKECLSISCGPTHSHVKQIADIVATIASNRH